MLTKTHTHTHTVSTPVAVIQTLQWQSLQWQSHTFKLFEWQWVTPKQCGFNVKTNALTHRVFTIHHPSNHILPSTPFMGAPGRGCQSTRHQDSSELKRRCSSLLKIPAGVSRSRGCYRWITKDRGVWLCMVAHVCRAHHTKHTTMPPGSVSNWNLVRITEYDWNQQENTSMTNKKFQLNMKHILVLRVLLQQIWSMRLFTLHLFWPISLIKHILHKATLVFEWMRVEGLERFTAIICEMLHSCHFQSAR